MNNSPAHTLRRAVALAVCLPVLILALAACTDGQDDDLEEEAEQTQTFAQEETNTFANDVEAVIREADRELEQIGQRIENAGDEAETEIEAEWEELRQRRDSLQADLDSLEMKEGEEAREMREELQGRMTEYERDLRATYLKSIQSKKEFAKAARTEIQEIDQQIEQMEQNVSQMDSTRNSEYEETLSDLKEEREELEENLEDVMESGNEEWADVRAAIAEDIAAFRSEVDQAFDDVQVMDRRPRAANTGGQ